MPIVDAEVRKEILNTSGSIVVSASAGSGKTTIMIHKILKKLAGTTDHRTVAAITFTIKATEEIRKKANEKGVVKEFVVMTNDSFVEQEIIRPFLITAFDVSYNNDFLVTYDRQQKFSSFDEGVERLRRENKLGVYFNNEKNFKFELAKRILEQSQAAREYFKARYSMLFLDEYQDSDLDMHELFMYIKNELDIDLFIVGDAKQAIYLWRGAQKNIFSLLEQEDFSEFELIHNFRSHFEIVNYANAIHDFSQFVETDNEDVTRVIHCITNDGINSIDKMFKSEELDIKKSITIIANVHDDAKKISDRLNELGYHFIYIPRTPLDDSSEHSHILLAIVRYVIDVNYSVYDIAEILRIEQIKSVLNKIEELLAPLKSIVSTRSDLDEKIIRNLIDRFVNGFNDYFDLEINSSEIDLLVRTLSNKFYYSAFIKTNDLHKVMTVFGSKGLEFNQVVSFSRYYNFKDQGKRNNHYVCVTRAEEKFIMIEDGNYSDSFIQGIKDNGISSTKELFKRVEYI